MSKKKQKVAKALKEFVVFRIDGDGALHFLDEVKEVATEEEALEKICPNPDDYEFFVIDSSLGRAFIRESVFVPFP